MDKVFKYIYLNMAYMRRHKKLWENFQENISKGFLKTVLVHDLQ